MTRTPELCPTCQGPLLPEARFCPHCGRGLGLPLPEPHEAYTPRHLIEEVLDRRSVLEGERKLATVLFLDVVDSVQHSASLGMERWHFALKGLFRLLAEGVHRFDGDVNQYTGDGIMALFGAPIAHEDHAQRACYAALQLRDRVEEYAAEAERRLDERFDVRMALHSGDIVVGPIGDDLRMDYTAHGAVVGIAARLEAIAEPGSIFLSGRTAELASAFVTTESLGERQLKGIERPVSVFRLLGRGSVQDRFSQSRVRGLSRFCGRESELGWLDSLLEGAREGRPALVGLQGDAGVGKSRLLHEFGVGARTQGAEVFELRGVTHRQLTPFESVAPLLRQLLGLRPGAEAKEKFDPGDRAFEIAPELRPFLRGLLGVRDEEASPEPAPDAQERVFLKVMRRLVLERSKNVPVIIMLDDVDWLDAPSQRLLGDLAASLMSDASVLFLVSQREGSLGSWARRSRYQERRLEPLSVEQAEDLARALLGEDESTLGLREDLLERCSGNPFFLEEMVRALAETGHIEGLPGAYTAATSHVSAVLPETVHAVLGSRIDRLPDLEKQVIRAAAIVGREFTEDLVRELTELAARDIAGALHNLRLADFVEERWLEAEPTYYFRHPLVQEVAYRTQLSANRGISHRRVAEILAMKKADDPAVAARRSAHHWELAGEPLRAARAWAESSSLGSLADRIETWQRVSDQLALAGDSPEARSLGATACGQRLSLGWHHGLSAEEAQALVDHGLSLMCGDEREPIVRSLLLTYHSRVLLGTEGGDAYAEGAALARAQALETGWDLLVDGIDASIAQALLYAGRLPEALATSEATLPRLAARQANRLQTSGFQATPDLWLRAVRGEILTLMGRGADGREALLEVIEEAERRGEVELLVLPRFSLIRSEWMRGSGVDVRDQAEEAFRTATNLASERSLVMAKGGIGIAALLAGNAPAAARHLTEAIARARDRRTGTELEPLLEAHLGAARLEAGDAGGAIAAADAAAATSRERNLRVFECQAQLERARASAALGRHADSETARHRCASLAAQTGAVALKNCLDRSGLGPT